MAGKKFHFLFLVYMTANIPNFISAGPLDSKLSHLEENQQDIKEENDNGNMERLKYLTDEFQEVVEGMNRIEYELSELEKYSVPTIKANQNASLDDILRSVQSIKSSLGINYKEVKTTKGTTTLAQDCQELLKKGNTDSGVYEIKPQNSPKSFMVLCDMELNGGGWTHIQKRFDGSQDFYQEWREYKFGFGDLDGEFWIGLENIHYLTEPNAELLVELVDLNGQKAYAHYETFSVGPEVDGYPLNSLNGFSGTVGDAMTYHLGQKFSTKDYDQDKDSGSCAIVYYGAWWYNSCLHSNPNGKYINVKHPPTRVEQGLYWSTFGGGSPLAQSRLLVKQKVY